MKQICRPLLFKRSMKRFHIGWWAFSFPLSALALASIEYHRQVKLLAAKVLMLLLLGLSVLVAVSLVAVTLLKFDTLLPEDDPLFSVSNHSNVVAIVNEPQGRET